MLSDQVNTVSRKGDRKPCRVADNTSRVVVLCHALIIAINRACFEACQPVESIGPIPSLIKELITEPTVLELALTKFVRDHLHMNPLHGA